MSDLQDMLKKREALKASLAKQEAAVGAAREALYAQERAAGALQKELADCEAACLDGMGKGG